jgi:hypothetical protein
MVCHVNNGQNENLLLVVKITRGIRVEDNMVLVSERMTGQKKLSVQNEIYHIRIRLKNLECMVKHQLNGVELKEH